MLILIDLFIFLISSYIHACMHQNIIIIIIHKENILQRKVSCKHDQYLAPFNVGQGSRAEVFSSCSAVKCITLITISFQFYIAINKVFRIHNNLEDISSHFTVYSSLQNVNFWTFSNTVFILTNGIINELYKTCCVCVFFVCLLLELHVVIVGDCWTGNDRSDGLPIKPSKGPSFFLCFQRRGTACINEGRNSE